MACDSIFAINTCSFGGAGRDDSGAALPMNRVKFLCSHSGRIMHRPTDGKLKYVGGETRVVAVSRGVGFSELMRRLSELVPGEMVLKYQMLPEDLDALVSVKSDDDLKHMIEEHDRRDTKGASNLRSFLFPAKPIPVESQALEQHYIDAINGLIVCTTTSKRKWISSNNALTIAPLANPISSPDDNKNNNNKNNEQNGMLRNKSSMSKVQSSPSLCNLGSAQKSHMHQHSQSQNPNQNQNRYQDYSQKVGLPPIYMGQGQGPNYYYPSSTHPKRFGNEYGGKCYDDSSYSTAPPRQYENGSGRYCYDDNAPEVLNHVRGANPVPPRQYGSGGSDSSYGTMPEMGGRAQSQSMRNENSYNVMPETASRGRSPSPMMDGQYGSYNGMQEMPSRGRSPGPMSVHSSRGRSPGPAHSSRGRSPGPRFE